LDFRAKYHTGKIPVTEQDKVLGVHWDPVQDTFGYHSMIDQVTPTTRYVLSTVARFYMTQSVRWTRWYSGPAYCRRCGWTN